MKPCATCREACCRKPGWPVGLTVEDLARLWPDHSEAIVPTVGEGRGYFVAQVAKDASGACVFVRDDGCSIHETKPEHCRNADPWTCGVFEADPEKVAGRRRLRVVEAEATTR